MAARWTFSPSLAAQAVFRESHDQIQAALDALKRLDAADFAAAREFHKDPDHGIEGGCAVADSRPLFLGEIDGSIDRRCYTVLSHFADLPFRFVW